MYSTRVLSVLLLICAVFFVSLGVYDYVNADTSYCNLYVVTDQANPPHLISFSCSGDCQPYGGGLCHEWYSPDGTGVKCNCAGYLPANCKTVLQENEDDYTVYCQVQAGFCLAPEECEIEVKENVPVPGRNTLYCKCK